MSEYFAEVYASDIIDHSADFPAADYGVDFLLDWPGSAPGPFDFIFTNPPFRLASEFLELALDRAAVGVAFFVKQQFLESLGRYEDFFAESPPVVVLQFAERVPLVSGRVDPDAATNQAYIWAVWVKDAMLAAALRAAFSSTSFGWIAPSRGALERVGDYPAPPSAISPEDLPLFGEGAQ